MNDVTEQDIADAIVRAEGEWVAALAEDLPALNTQGMDFSELRADNGGSVLPPARSITPAEARANRLRRAKSVLYIVRLRLALARAGVWTYRGYRHAGPEPMLASHEIQDAVNAENKARGIDPVADFTDPASKPEGWYEAVARRCVQMIEAQVASR